MKDIVTPVPPEEVKGVIRKCLEQAAHLNYERIKEYATIEGNQKHTKWSKWVSYIMITICINVSVCHAVI